MAVKHDLVAENQNSAQATQNIQKLQMLLRLVRGAEPNTLEPFCEAIVKYLCQESYPAIDNESIKQFKDVLVAYRDQLKDLCADSTSETSQLLIQGCLKSLYKQMVCGGGRPCVAAAIILDLFNSANIPLAVRWMLNTGDQNSSDEALAKVFETLTRWLNETTVIANIHVWMCELLSGLYEERRYDLLNEIVMAPLPNLMNLVKVPVFRTMVLSVLQRMLVCDGRAPKVFHAMLPKLGEIIRSFNGQVHEQEILFLKTIQEWIGKYPESGGGSERYKDINHILNVFKHKLGSSLGTTTHPSLSSANLVRLENNNPRVGLVNLGNTCYMNSVLQALVMTKHFSRELLLSYPRTTAMMTTSGSGHPSGSLKTELVFTIQKLLAQLLHSRRPELTPREVLHVTRPPSFLPGHQQDSSEFLSHLMDTLHEHELAVRNKQQQQQKVTSGGGQTPQRRKRPATGTTVTQEEDEDTGISVSRQKMAAVAALKDQLMAEEYEDEVDGLEGKGDPVNNHTLIQRSFGGLLDTTYHCLACGQKSTIRDAFRDVSLSFGMDKDSKYYVQHLLDYYCLSEKLEGDNQYHCEKCAKLCDGLRSQSFVSPPKNLILTLKHFKYDQQYHTRAKLMHNVVLNEMVTIKVHGKGGNAGQGKNSPVACNSSSALDSSSSSGGAVGGGGGQGMSSGESTRLAKYQLYAVVVHSGMSMDAGHYYTYASDEPDSWYMFNDSYVTKCGVGDVHRLRAPNTPYILFYRLVDNQAQEEMVDVVLDEVEEAIGGPGESLPELEELPSYLKDFVVKDNFTYCQEMQKEGGSKEAMKSYGGTKYNYYRKDEEGDDDQPPPQSSCGGNAIDSSNSYIC